MTMLATDNLRFERPSPPPLPADSPESTALSTKELVSKQVQTVMSKTVAPEDQPRFDVPARATQADAAGNISTFELRAGASDVTSYHDFSSLQIAFEHIWTEVFDGRLRQLGVDLYRQYVHAVVDSGRPVDPNRVISSITDLQMLLAEIKEFSSLTDGTIQTDARHVGNTVQNELLSTETRDGTSTGVTPPNVIAGASRLSALLKEIDDILAKPYSFTVFEKDSINFGIRVTYRQTWKPESYQVGDLVSTIPLAPREMRRYTTKRVSKKTRAVKELDDNVRTTKTEADSTSRVEREILDRAEEKTNFNATVHESFGGQGYQIDATQQGGGDQSKISAETKMPPYVTE